MEPVCQAGLNLLNPAKRAGDGCRASLECTKALTASLITCKDLDVNGFASNIKEARAQTRKTKALRGLSALKKTLCNAEDQHASRHMVRAKETGVWLNNPPNTLNGTVLAEEEFRDSLQLRFGLAPLKLPSTCNRCEKKFVFNHAQQCPKRGLILHCLNDVATEWSEMCARALKPLTVSDEPFIHTGWVSLNRKGNEDTPINKDLRGDIGVHGFWKTGNRQSLTLGSRIPIACHGVTGTPTRSWHNTKRRRRSDTPLHALISIIILSH